MNCYIQVYVLMWVIKLLNLQFSDQEEKIKTL